ncbi:hypothetical protein [Flavobacterium sp. GSA192]|uniref:hypothetical protein n=1 Tax=Flavobacterium sp. GSA192 TaxID=2576304 RepID=UPI00112773D6|nr:hypothetical protein [Flavobacterium sp. GSA192]
MTYKIFYIEDLDPESRIETLRSENFEIISFKPDVKIDDIIQKISDENPDIILMDYKLTEGSQLSYCDAPTIASTLRSKYNDGIKERPIVLISTLDNIVNIYRKDYTSHDLFDYAISKEKALENPERFRKKCLSFLNSYTNITQNKFDLDQILSLKGDVNLIHSRIRIHLNKDVKSVYEYSRFIFEHLIRCSGLLIGEDILSARLGVSKDSPDWGKLKEQFSDYKYTGVFSDVYNRWWMSRIDSWWLDSIKEKHTLRHYNAEERIRILREKFVLDLDIVISSDKNLSSNYWTICKQTKLPLDPFDGIELLEEEFKPWQDKDYVSIDGYLANIDKYSKIVSEIDRKEMRKYS